MHHFVMPRTSEKSFVCRECNQNFPNNSRLMRHLHVHKRMRDIIVCDICHERISHKTVIHVCTEAKSFVQEECNKSSSSPLNLMRHQCEVCHKICSSRSKLSIHLRAHTGVKPFVCSFCNKRFSQSSGLKAHFLVHTKEKPHVCDVCGKRFSQKDSLKKHYRIHTGERPCQCEICKKCFSDPSALRYHLRMHTGEKPFSCDVCNKGFSQKPYLKKHTRLHT